MPLAFSASCEAACRFTPVRRRGIQARQTARRDHRVPRRRPSSARPARPAPRGQGASVRASPWRGTRRLTKAKPFSQRTWLHGKARDAAQHRLGAAPSCQRPTLALVRQHSSHIPVRFLIDLPHRTTCPVDRNSLAGPARKQTSDRCRVSGSGARSGAAAGGLGRADRGRLRGADHGGRRARAKTSRAGLDGDGRTGPSWRSRRSAATRPSRRRRCPSPAHWVVTSSPCSGTCQHGSARSSASSAS